MWASRVVLVIKEPIYKCRRAERQGLDPWVDKMTSRRS